MEPYTPKQPSRSQSNPFRRSIQPLPTRQSQRLRTDREAAARIMREQIDRIYDTDSPHKEAETAIFSAEAEATTPSPQLSDDSVYAQTQSSQPIASQNPSSQWQDYHSAWQNYYRQYYERYYIHQLHQTKTQLEAKAQAAATPSQYPAATTRTLTTDEAVDELRNDLLSKVRTSAKKARRSRHFVPIASALVVGLMFTFLQYNRLIFSQVEAYVSPGNIDPQNIVLDPTTNVKVDERPRLIIPKINVDAPVVYGLRSIAEEQVQKSLESGVVHYPIPGASSVPGQVGNTAILGHSSNDVFDNGAYKFIFVQLDRLTVGDTFYAHYKGTRYTYSVTKKEVIEPTQISKLAIKTDKPLMTLITCVPPGTALKRLIVVAEQISPDPDRAKASVQTETKEQPKQLPANSPTLLERFFGG